MHFGLAQRPGLNTGRAALILAILSVARAPLCAQDARLQVPGGAPESASPELRIHDSPATKVPARVTAPAAPATPEPSPPPSRKLEPVFFNGVQLGTSSTADVNEAWGAPLSESRQGALTYHSYAMDPFEKVEVTFFKDKALSLAIHLKQRFSPKILAEQLELNDVEPVLVTNDEGAIVGQSYPERGVAFSFFPKAKTLEVAQLLLDTPDSQPFVLRAQSRRMRSYTGCLADLQTALEIDPQDARAYALRAQVLADLGQRTEALDAARAACAADSQNPEYLLIEAMILADLDRQEDAVTAVERAIGASGKRPEVKARAVSFLGLLAGTGQRRDFKLSLDYQLQAIEQAEALLDDPRVDVRRMARETLVDAHLISAQGIAWGYWKMKATVVPKWLDRARLASEELRAIDTEAEERHRLYLSAQALAALAGLDGQVDPQPWIEPLLKTRLDEGDPLLARAIHFRLGRALSDAAEILHERGENDAALDIGLQAVRHWEIAKQQRQMNVAESFGLGRLYFRIGSIHAIHLKDHAQAVAWFDKVAAALEQPALPADADPGRVGQSLVSMAVSYWSRGQQDRAMRLTDRGLELMSQAVDAGTLDPQSLNVPYTNLATMHQHLGHDKRATEYAEMAARVDAIRR